LKDIKALVPWDGSRKLYFSPLFIGPEVLGTICGEMHPKAQRRTFPFDARAEVTLANSDPVDARVRELSSYGFFVRFLIPVSPGTPVFVKIFVESETFEANGMVIYFQPDVGFALAFRDIKPQFLAVLKKWLQRANEEIESRDS
jgi:hypothetical protein